jgi:uncharacterized Zn-binding protein involved in type VI secretion
MPPAARRGDPTNHPGAVAGPGAATVLIAGVPAARSGDRHACRAPEGHPPTPFVAGSAMVLIEGAPALRVGDRAGCGACVVSGAATVFIGG